MESKSTTGWTLALGAGTALTIASAAFAQCGPPWTQIAGSSPGARYGHTMVYESATNRTILAGYSATFGQPGETWQYLGATHTWTQLLPSVAPASRLYAAMAYDSTHSTIVLFGGRVAGPSQSSETWLFDPQTNTWTNPLPTAHPSAREGHAVAYDSARQRVVLFGGATFQLTMADTWEYDAAANTWTQRLPAHSPPPSAWHAMTFDPTRARVVLLRAPGVYNTSPGEQWEWDGDSWQQIQASNIPPSWVVFAAFDAARGRCIAFRDDDVWDYDASAHRWTQHPAPGLGERSQMAMAFDQVRSVAVFQGGIINGQPTLSDTWEWTGSVSAGPAVSRSPSPTPLGATLLGQSTSLSIAATGNGQLLYQWLRDGQPLIDGNGISGSQTPVLSFNPLRPEHHGTYAVRLSDACGEITTPSASVLPELNCYANCDGSTTPPFLNVNDFICFQAKFAAGETYANCDHGYSPPVLNVNDFVCFMAAFAAGCP